MERVNQSPEQHRKSVSLNTESGLSQWVHPELAADADSFGSFVQFLKKRGWIVAVALVLGIAAAQITDTVVQKRYTSLAQIEIVPEITPQFRLEQVQGLGSGSDETEKLDTEIEILNSPTLLMETIQALHLENNRTFCDLDNGRAWNVSVPGERAILLNAFHRDLDVRRQGHTEIIQVRVTTRDPALSALIADTLIDKYIERSFHANYAATMRVSGWLGSQLDDLRRNLEKSQTQMIAYQKDLGVVGPLYSSGGQMAGSENMLVANLDEMIRNSASASVDRMVKEALYNAIKSSSPDVIDATAAMTDPELMASKQELNGLESQYAALSQTYGKAYPQLQALQSQINHLQQKIAVEEKSAVATAQKQYEAALAHESLARTALETQKQEAFSKGEQVAKFDFALEDYESNRLLYDGLQERLQEAGILSGLHSTSIQVVDNAEIPVQPSYPRKTLNLSLGTGIGLLFGFGLALLLEALDINLKTILEIEQGLGLPLLAAIPAVKAEEISPEVFKQNAMSAGAAGWSRIAESLRGMRTSILLSSPGSPPKVIMVASSRPSEGKSSVATLFSITLALGASRVLLIDSDLRRPSIHLRFHISRHQGLSSALTGKSTFRDSIVEWPEMPNLHIMASGPTPPLPSELLGSKQMEDLIAAARQEYDFVILDTPPVLAVTDAPVIARLTDATILVLRYGTVQQHVVQRGIDILERSGAHVLGVAINAVDFKAPEYTEYYGRKYSDYYGERRPE